MNRTYATRLIAGTLAISCALGGLYIGTARTARAASTAALQADAGRSIAALAPRNERQEQAGQPKKEEATPPLVSEAASVLGIDGTELVKQLQAGKSIAEVAKERGVSEDVLTAKLLQLRGARIDEAVKNGKLEAAKADDMKQRMSRHLSFMINEKNLLEKHSMHKGRSLKPDQEQLAALLGISKDELQAQLKAGKSIAEIAASKGISRSKLIGKLKEQMSPKLESWIDRKHQVPASN